MRSPSKGRTAVFDRRAYGCWGGGVGLGFGNTYLKFAKEYPLILISGSKRKYFFYSEMHQVDSLRRQHNAPEIVIHPKTAASLCISDKSWVWVESIHGRVRPQANLSDRVAPDVVDAEHAWWYPESGLDPRFGHLRIWGALFKS